jgi:pyruvate-ferredoxin/flavodoxin oxidoreductase
VWPLYRFDPRRLVKGEPPLRLDYGPPKTKVGEYLRNESRFRTIERADPARYKAFVNESQAAAERRYAVYQQLAGITVPVIQTTDDTAPDRKDM